MYTKIILKTSSELLDNINYREITGKPFDSEIFITVLKGKGIFLTATALEERWLTRRLLASCPLCPQTQKWTVMLPV